MEYIIVFKKQIVIAFYLCTLCACATQKEGPESLGDEPSGRGSDCIFEGTIRDYRVLDESNLVVTARPKKKFHIELVHPAFGLSSFLNIGFTSTTSRICPGVSSLVFSSNFAPDSVRIRSIQAIDEVEYENLLIRFGKKQPDEIKTPPHEAIEGAEVEELD